MPKLGKLYISMALNFVVNHTILMSGEMHIWVCVCTDIQAEYVVISIATLIVLHRPNIINSIHTYKL